MKQNGYIHISLLQIAIDFEAVISRVGHSQMAVDGDGEALRPVERIAFRVDEGEKAALFVEDLDARVAPVGDDDDVGLGVDGDPRRGVELSVAFAARAEGEEEGAVGNVEDFDPVIVVVGDEEVIGRRVHGHELRGGELVFRRTALAESGVDIYIYVHGCTGRHVRHVT